uniref:Retinoblastoma binding protein-1 n=1 Tax=Schmidtea mediterranea TaxID=79327 RepID=I1ZIK2_SCHMD|nr:retinoblastoma binding protein-1 [Schmidtea mediterranea]
MIEDISNYSNSFCKDNIRWKKNISFLYDFVKTNNLTWPSLTVQWMPDITKLEDKDYVIQRIIVGTQTEEEQDYLLIASVTVPNEYKCFESKHYDAEKDEFGGYGLVTAHTDISIKINHDGCINRARYLPQCPNVIATKSSNGNVYLFDYTRHPSKPDQSGKCKPDLVLKGHSQEGFGLSWNIKNAGVLLSSAVDGTIQLWDINCTPENKNDFKVLNSLSQYLGHEGSVEDVCWHKFSDQLFGSVGVDKNLLIWDRRESKPAVKVMAHSDDVVTLDFNPFSEYILATGSEDKTIGLWDLRNMGGSLKYLRGHEGSIGQLQWSLHKETILASGGSDNKVHLWDLKKTGTSKENTYSEELAFIHAGHCSRVIDFAWNGNEPLMMASVSYDNILQLWQPSEFLKL